MTARPSPRSAGLSALVARLALGLLEAFEQGVVGMQIGARRRLIAPPALGYGSRGSPPSIPPDAMLEFDIELIYIEPK